MTGNVFEDWLGEAMAQKLVRAKFEPAGPEGYGAFMSHKFSQSILLTNEEPDPEQREKIVQHYMHFFEEIIDKMQVQAMELIPKLALPPTLTEDIGSYLRMFMEMILRGYSTYRPYLMEAVPMVADDIKKGVNVALYMALPDVNAVSNQAEIYWLIKTEYWQRDWFNSNVMRRIDTIESSSDYTDGPLEF